MKSIKFTILLASLLITFFCSASNKEKQTTIKKNINSEFFIGWATADITPNRPVLLQGQYAARVSERIKDPLMSSALAIESVTGNSSENSILISCDLLYVNDGLRDNVRRLLKETVPEINSDKIILSATHTHTAPSSASQQLP